MGIDFSKVTSLIIPEGEVKEIKSSTGKLIWSKSTPIGTYYKVDGTTLYLRGTSKSGYTKYTSSYITGSEAGNQALTSVVVDSSNPIVLPSNIADMFGSCSLLTSLDLSNFDTSNVTDMSAMFFNCSSLSSLDLSNFDTSNVIELDGVFGNCNQLTSLDLSGWDTNSATIMSQTFDSCTSLQHIYVGSGWTVANVTESSSMFSGCTNLHNFNSSYIDKTYAIIDDGTNDGYLESKA